MRNKFYFDALNEHSNEMAQIVTELKQKSEEIRNLQRENKSLQNKSDELMRQNKALIDYHSTLKDKKELLRIEEIEKVQQSTIKDMKIMNEEIYTYFDTHLSKHLLNYERSTCILDLGREIAALKVTLHSYETQIAQKDTTICTLKSTLSKAELKIEDLMVGFKKVSAQNMTLSRPMSPLSMSGSMKNSGTASFHELPKSHLAISEKLDNTYGLFKNLMTNIQKSNEKYELAEEALHSNYVSQNDLNNIIEHLKSEHELVLAETTQEYEHKLSKYESEKAEGLDYKELDQQLTEVIEKLNSEMNKNRDLQSKYKDLENLNQELKSELRGYKEVLEQVKNDDSFSNDKENTKLIKSMTKFSFPMTPKQETMKSHNMMPDFNDKFVLKCSEFSIVPSKITCTLLEYKKKQIKVENTLKKKMLTENKYLDQIKAKNEEIHDLKTQLKYFKPSDSMTLSVNEDEVSIDQEIRDKLYELENENIELKKQINEQIVKHSNDNSMITNDPDCGCAQSNSCILCPLIDSLIYLSNRVIDAESDSKCKPSIEVSQRVVIKSLTNTLAKLINDNDLSCLNIEEFVPSDKDDITVWYLDLLETQLQFSKELMVELKDYYESLRHDQNYDNSKQLKAAYYELASNTKSVSDQIKNISSCMSLIKHDLEHKAPIFGQNSDLNSFGAKKDGAENVENNYLSQIEHLKNELNLVNKVKTTLEKQHELYNKSKNNQESEHIQKVREMTSIMKDGKSQIEQQSDEISRLIYELELANTNYDEAVKDLKSKASEIIELNTKVAELESQVAKLQKPSLETMKRDNLAMKSKQREKETQIKDLMEKVKDLEKDNEELKSSIKQYKKEIKEAKTDADLKHKQSFRIVQSERDELEQKLRSEIQLRQQDAQRWFNDRQYLDGIIENLRSQNTSLIQTQPQPLIAQTVEIPNEPPSKSKLEKYKKKNQQKSKKIDELQNKLITLENEKEEYRIKYSSLQSQADNKNELIAELKEKEQKIRDLEKELRIKSHTQDSLTQKEAYIRLQTELEN